MYGISPVLLEAEEEHILDVDDVEELGEADDTLLEWWFSVCRLRDLASQ